MLKDLKILLVEDDKLFQQNIKMFLEGVVKELYQAYDGEEGIEKFKKYRPDIVITDISMPKKDGIEMSKEIKKIDSNTPIIILSAFDDKEFLLDAINNVGIDGYILKPINLIELYNKLEVIAKKLKEERKFKDLIYHDCLTKVFNRRAFEKEVELLINDNKDFALFFIDLDDFKVINDKYGHKIGDEVLKFVANSIKEIVRKDDFVARIGGDEFVLIIEGINEVIAKEIAQKIINRIKDGIETKKGRIEIGCSIGITFYPKSAKSKEELIALADKAMYRVKKEGKKGIMIY